MELNFEKRCWAEVDLGQMRRNFAAVRSAVPTAQVMAVVKANAYGHGDMAVARVLDEAGAQRFAVAGFEEAVRLRRGGIQKPLLILGYSMPQNAALLARYNLEQCVPNLAYAKALSAAAKSAGVEVAVHFKVDTGMGRLGFTALTDERRAVDEIHFARHLPGLCPVGLFTHFAVADSLVPDDVAYTGRQGRLLVAVRDGLAALGDRFCLVHCCNSAGIATQPGLHLDAVRPGIILYGCAPSGEVTLPGVATAVKLKSTVTMVKNLCAGQQVSYGRTFTAPVNMQVATLAVGYADGYPRLLSNRGVTGFGGLPAPVVGRVCMDQIVVDISNVPGVEVGCVATVYGGDGADSVDDVAKKAGTINYEVVCAIGRRVPRVYTENGVVQGTANYLEGCV